MKGFGSMVVAATMLASAASAAVSVTIDKSTQRMSVEAPGVSRVWPVSTARPGYVTPNGTFHVTRLDPYHRSSKYENAPMPWSIFFHGGYAIHGTLDEANLGRPVSHGCVRLSRANARELFDMVSADGGRASIRVVGGTPAAATPLGRLERALKNFSY